MKYYRNVNMNEMLSQLNIRVSEGAYIVTDKTWKGKSICSPYSRLYFVDGGEGVLHFREEEIVMQPGNVYLIPTRFTYNYSCKESINKLYFHINIFKNDGYDLLDGCKTCGQMKYDVEKISMLRCLYKSQNIYDAFMLKDEISKSLINLLNLMEFKGYENRRYSQNVQNTIEYIQKNLSLQLGVKKLADRSFISESSLMKQFKQETGRTIGKYIDDLIFFKAERMLASTNMSIKQISDDLGFCDQFYFSSRFSKKLGETPLKYKKRMQVAENFD